MTKKLNEAGVLAISNIGCKRDGSASNFTPKTEKVRLETKGLNARTVERTDSDKSSDFKERAHYADQMKTLVGDTQVPAVQYKGSVIPRRVLSDYSYLTR